MTWLCSVCGALATTSDSIFPDDKIVHRACAERLEHEISAQRTHELIGDFLKVLGTERKS